MVTPAMIAMESTLGIWFLHRKRFPVVGLLKVAGFAALFYVVVFYVRANRHPALRQQLPPLHVNMLMLCCSLQR